MAKFWKLEINEIADGWAEERKGRKAERRRGGTAEEPEGQNGGRTQRRKGGTAEERNGGRAEWQYGYIPNLLDRFTVHRQRG